MAERAIGSWSVIFQCDETTAEVTVSRVKATTSEEAEFNARYMLAKGYTWRSIGIDRDMDW